MLATRRFWLSLFLVGKGLLLAAPEVVKREVPDGVMVGELDAASIERSQADMRERENDYLLVDRQVNVAEQTDYSRVALRVAGEGGLQEAGRWSVTFDPEYQEVWFHRIDVHRGGEVSERLAEAEFRYLEQESESSYHLYNGQVTASTLLPDLRVGDVVDVAYTVKGRNPVFEGRYFDACSLGWGQPLAQLRSMVSAPVEMKLGFKLMGDGAPQPEVRLVGDQRQVVWEATQLPAVAWEDGTPSWYPVYPWAQFSEFSTWDDVVGWALPLYGAGREEPDGGLLAEVEALLEPLGEQPAAEDVAVELLAFVQREIRYLGIELGVSSHRPHLPSETYARRFGDCKDKAVLLVQLLRSRGITAYPVLVNSSVGQALDRRLPSPGVFDHVIVGIELADRMEWVDPTMAPSKGSLRHRAAPDYGWGLVIREGEAGLSRIEQPVEASRRIESTEVMTSKGFDQPGTLQVITRYHGVAALSIREYFNGSTPEQISQTYQDYYGGIYAEITIEGVPVLRDLENGSAEVVENYTVPSLWSYSKDAGQWRLETYPLIMDSYLPYGLVAKRRTPKSISHAVDISLRQELHVHESWGLDFPPVDIDSAGFSYTRRAEGDGTQKLVIDHHYQSKASYVEASAMPAYVAAVNEAREAFGLELTWTEGANALPVDEDEPYAPNLLMFVIAIGGFVGAHAVIFWWVRHRRRQPPAIPESINPELTGLGGWLVLPGIGLVLSPIRFCFDLFGDSAVSFDANIWSALTTPGLETTDVSLAVLILVEVLANVLMLALALWCVVQFFRRDRSFPTLMRFYLIFCLAVTIGDTVALEAMDLSMEEADAAKTYADIFRQVVSVVIWVPYFGMSQRVRNTFTR